MLRRLVQKKTYTPLILITKIQPWSEFVIIKTITGQFISRELFGDETIF